MNRDKQIYKKTKRVIKTHGGNESWKMFLEFFAFGVEYKQNNWMMSAYTRWCDRENEKISKRGYREFIIRWMMIAMATETIDVSLAIWKGVLHISIRFDKAKEFRALAEKEAEKKNIERMNPKKLGEKLKHKVFEDKKVKKVEEAMLRKIGLGVIKIRIENLNSIRKHLKVQS